MRRLIDLDELIADINHHIEQVKPVKEHDRKWYELGEKHILEVVQTSLVVKEEDNDA